MQLVTTNEKLEKEVSGKTEGEKVDEKQQNYYEEELAEYKIKISELEDELSRLTKQELDKITDEFSLG